MIEQPKSAKHLYKRGWLGLIPLIGGFIGLGLIFLGLLKYRDRKLTLIGTAALMFTALFYGSIVYYFQFSMQFRRDYAKFSQPNMNDLVKHIEFYMTENGAYPDSLEQLTSDMALVVISDPIADRKINKGKFYYKKVGNRYTLFSAGVDRVPFTTDDIFPSPNFYDTTKTGLIKAEE